MSSGFESGYIEKMISRCRSSLEALGRGNNNNNSVERISAHWFELDMATALVYKDPESFEEALKDR